MALPHLSIKKHFRKLRDPRVTGRSTHLLLDIIRGDGNLDKI